MNSFDAILDRRKVVETGRAWIRAAAVQRPAVPIGMVTRQAGFVHLTAAAIFAATNSVLPQAGGRAHAMCARDSQLL